MIETVSFVGVLMAGQLGDFKLAGPFAVLFSVLLATVCLRLRGENWRNVGLEGRGWAVTLLEAVLIYAVVLLSVLFVLEPLAEYAGWPARNLSSCFDGYVLPG